MQSAPESWRPWKETKALFDSQKYQNKSLKINQFVLRGLGMGDMKIEELTKKYGRNKGESEM